jgi:hypothetical protein
MMKHARAAWEISKDVRIVKYLLLIIALTVGSLSELPGSAQNTGSEPSSSVSQELHTKLLSVKRFYVESFGDDPTSRQIQAFVIDSLTASKRFIITENKEKADAVIKGIATQQTSQELHSNSEGTAIGNRRSGAGISDSSAATETVTQAKLAIRIVSADGDVLWSVERESSGGKYKGAGATVADDAVKQLLRDLEKPGS